MFKQVKSAKDLMTKGFKVKGLGGTRLQPAVDKLVELGKTKEAQSFYKALKESYPDSPEAKKVK